MSFVVEDFKKQQSTIALWTLLVPKDDIRKRLKIARFLSFLLHIFEDFTGYLVEKSWITKKNPKIKEKPATKT